MSVASTYKSGLKNVVIVVNCIEIGSRYYWNGAGTGRHLKRVIRDFKAGTQRDLSSAIL
jgi:hypothetical protein